MSAIVRFTGWSRGLKKLALTKLIRAATDVPLDEAHKVVNDLLTDKIVDVTVSSKEKARELAQAACELGAQAQCVENELRTGTYG